MEEQFILRVPPTVAERIERLLNDPTSSSEDKSLDLSFSVGECQLQFLIREYKKVHDQASIIGAQCTTLPAFLSSSSIYYKPPVDDNGRTGSFFIGNDHFSASLLDLPTVVESYKTYDDSALIKTSDIGQMIMVTEEGDSIPDTVEYRHGLTPPMRDARRRRFRREPDLNPEVVRRVEKDLQNIMAGGTAEYIISVAMAEQEEDGEENARISKKARPTSPAMPDVPEAGTVGRETNGSDSEESDDSI